MPFTPPTGEGAVYPPAVEGLSSERPVLRRQLYRAYRGWLGQLVTEQRDRIPGRNQVIEHLRCWDLRYSEEQPMELATLLLEEVPIAMMAALGRTCRDRRININVRMVLARDYQHYRKLAREMVEAGSQVGQELRKQKEEKVLAAIRREEELAAAREEEPVRRGWWQKMQRAWWICRAWQGWKIPQEKLGNLVDLYRKGNDEEMMERFYELGGTVEKMEGGCPPWSIDGDVWNEETGEIWNVEPCFQGGKSIYVGNMFKDPVIRGRENPYFRKSKN